MKRAFIILSVFCFTGCAAFVPWTQLQEAEYRDGARKFSAIIPKGWMRFNLAEYFVITRDGTVLDEIVVERGKIDKKLEFTKKKFFKNMTTQDIAEIEVDNFKSNKNISKFELIQNKPVNIDGYEAFCIEYTYFTQSGLKIHGIHYGLQKKDWIYRIFYTAAEQHYFKKYLKDFDSFVESFKLIDK